MSRKRIIKGYMHITADGKRMAVFAPLQPISLLSVDLVFSSRIIYAPINSKLQHPPPGHTPGI